MSKQLSKGWPHRVLTDGSAAAFLGSRSHLFLTNCDTSTFLGGRK